jgi:hypothetical protein
LPTLASVRPAAGPATQPRSALERTVADVWRDVLRIEAVGLRDNFFELGGTSLLVVPVHTRLRDACDPSLSLRRDVSVSDRRGAGAPSRARALTQSSLRHRPKIQRTVGAEGIRRRPACAHAARPHARIVRR